MVYYISVDIESDGQIPHRNSMLSLGAAALTLNEGIIDTFSINLGIIYLCDPVFCAI